MRGGGKKIPKEYKWRVQIATRKNKKGRASGGMLLGIRKRIEEIKEEKKLEEEKGKIECKIMIREKIWRIIGLYVNNDIDRKLKGLKDTTEEKKKRVRTIIGGDFNARTGEEGGWEEEDEERVEGGGRRSKDKKINRDGRKLLEFIEERGWMILNGGVKGDEEGEFTYTGGRGKTVIDYVIGEVREGLERLEVGERVDSDHHPVTIWMKGKLEKDQRKREGERVRRRGIWSEEERTQFKERLRTIVGGNGEIQEEIEVGISRIRKVIEENKNERGRRDKKNGRRWWDKECKEKKREVRKELRKWRKGRGEVERYREERKEYREMCKRKKKEEKERIIREIGEAKTEGKVWELISRVRKKRKRINEKIKMKEWREYFMELMGGMENKVLKGEGRRNRQKEEKIELEEVRNVIKKLKAGKAIGNDGIPNEAWKFGGEEMEKCGYGKFVQKI
ncbi:uncharacterized protein LOC143903409 [Temnothorax americanus]|uniref:uncharacterized protein LOC143903409 n=1 Tax=Temnothorax americanus TaxID=1964332 RepID=UPI0040684883